MARRSLRSLRLSGDPEADALLTEEPLALLIGMVLDQQIPLEWAFKGPYELTQRVGPPLDAARLAAMPPEDLVAAFSARPALHRYPGSMAARVQSLCQVICDEHDGDPASVWNSAPDGAALLRQVKALPGFGDQKAKIFVALLGKQLGVRPAGWEHACSPFGEPGSFRSVADIVDEESLAQVRATKAAMKAAAKAGAGKAAAGKAAAGKAAAGKAPAGKG